jgi:hypothetical protein
MPLRRTRKWRKQKNSHVAEGLRCGKVAVRKIAKGPGGKKLPVERLARTGFFCVRLAPDELEKVYWTSDYYNMNQSEFVRMVVMRECKKVLSRGDGMINPGGV